MVEGGSEGILVGSHRICEVSTTVLAPLTLYSSLVSCVIVRSTQNNILIELLSFKRLAMSCVMGKGQKKDDDANRCIRLGETTHQLSDPRSAHRTVGSAWVWSNLGFLMDFWQIWRIYATVMMSEMVGIETFIES